MNLSPRALELVYAVFGPQSNTVFPAGIADTVLEIRHAAELDAQAIKAAQQAEAQAEAEPKPKRRGPKPHPANKPAKE